jgi:hypothetical protein
MGSEAFGDLLHWVRHFVTLQLYNDPDATSEKIQRAAITEARDVRDGDLRDQLQTLASRAGTGPEAAFAATCVGFAAKYRIGIVQVVASVLREIPGADDDLLVGAVCEHLAPAELRDPLIDSVNLPGLASKMVGPLAERIRRDQVPLQDWLREYARSILNEAGQAG